jgi:outer membrane protein assembly factor BamB
MKPVFLSLFWLASLCLSPVLAEDWRQFRGENGTGVTEAALPETWGEEEHVVWKAPLQGVGASSPVVVGKKVFLTTGVGGYQDLVRHVLCIDAESGEVLWDRTVESELPEVETVREDHGYTSATPVANDSRLFVFFGKSGVFAFDHDGKQLWNTKVGSNLSGWGSAASLVLHGDHVLVNACVESEALMALDQRTGEVRWKAGGLKESWHAPTLAEVDGKTQIIMGQAQYVKAFDASDGSELWNCKSGIAWYICPQPLVKEGKVYVIGGRSGIGGVAVKLGGSGDVTASHRLWRLNQGTNVPTPVIHGDHLFFAHQDKGEAYCVDLESGEFVYEEERLSPNPGQIYASPILAGDKIVYLGRGGQAVIVKAGPRFEIVGSAKLENGRGVFNASPAVADGKLFIRSNKFLYCIEGH